MGDNTQAVKQAVFTTQSAIRPDQGVEHVAFFDEDGVPMTATPAEAVAWGDVTGAAAGAEAAIAAKTEVAALDAVDTADADDEASAVTLVNALKVAVNALIAALQA